MVNRQFWDDLRWGESHHSELLREYRDQWVAIENKQVVAAGTNLGQVEKEAQQKTGKSDIPVVFIDCGEHIYGQY